MMNNYSKRVLAAFGIAVIVLLSLFLMTNKSSLAIAAFCFSIVAVGVFFGMMFMTAAGSRSQYLLNAAFVFQARSYCFLNLFVCGIALILEQYEIWNVPVSIFCVVQIILLALFGWRYLAMDAGKEEISRIDKEVKIKVTNWKLIEADLRNIKECADTKYHKEIDQTIDAVRYADPMSNEALVSLDEAIKDCAVALEFAVQKKEDDTVSMTVMKILRLVKERNTKAKILK